MARRKSAGAQPADLTPKQEAFALAYFETGNAAEAYRRAYDVAENAKDSWVYVEACQLLDHPKIAQRIQELRAQAEKLSIYTRQKALDELEEARLLAIQSGAPAAAVSATNGKVRLFGLDAPARIRAEVTGKDGAPLHTIDPAKLSVAALRELMEALPDEAPDDNPG